MILLEANTIVGPAQERIRVARCTKEKKIVKKYDVLLRAKYFIVVEGFNPRIHALYFCPQLFGYDSEQKLVPLQGEEIGRLIAHAFQGTVSESRPWYAPMEKSPDQPIINTAMLNEFDTLVMDSIATRPQPLLTDRTRSGAPDELGASGSLNVD
jgi:hypothetical protein